MVATVIKLLFAAAIIIYVIWTARKKKQEDSYGRPGSANSAYKNGGLNQNDVSRVAYPETVRHSGTGPDISLWTRAASELSGTLSGPYDESGSGLTIAGMIGSRPFRIVFNGERKVSYFLTLPYAPVLENHFIKMHGTSESAFVMNNRIRLDIPSANPQTALLRELNAHAERILFTIPLDVEEDGDKPENAFLHRRDRTDAAEPPSFPSFKPIAAVVPDHRVTVTPRQEPLVPDLEPEKVPEKNTVQVPEPAALRQENTVREPEPTPVDREQAVVSETPLPSSQTPSSAGGEQELSPESVAEIVFRSTLPGPKEKEFFASLVGRRVEWSGTIRMAYEISSDFVFGNGKAIKVQMDLCTINGKFGRQTLRATAAFPPGDISAFRSASQKQIRFRGTILKLESFSREVYLSEGELL